MTPRKRVEAVMHGDMPDKVPLTMYERKIPQCTAERQLRNEGLCIVDRRVRVVITETPNVRHTTFNYTEKGVGYIKTVTTTPYGDLVSIRQPAGFTSWQVSKMFKGPDDYKRLMFTIKDQRFRADYEAFARAEQAAGEDVILRAGVGGNPLHMIMIHWMGVETFAIEWAERRDEILKLYDAMAAKQREIYPLVARSPASHANYGGNEVPEVMGKERFEKYVVPLYNEAADVFHEHGKLLGTHLDGNNKLWAQAVADSGLDYVEAFTPAPDCDMTVKEALDAWPGKFLWINFPSSVHLRTIPQIEDTTRDILRQAAPGNRLIIGITEDIPEDRWQQNMLAISRVINEEGRTPIEG